VQLYQTQRSYRVALLSMTAAGQGITLTAAQMVRQGVTYKYHSLLVSQL
jgi:hypothetical protein